MSLAVEVVLTLERGRVSIAGPLGRARLSPSQSAFFLLLLRGHLKPGRASGWIYWSEVRRAVRADSARRHGDRQTAARLVDAVERIVPPLIWPRGRRLLSHAPSERCAGPWRLAVGPGDIQFRLAQGNDPISARPLADIIDAHLGSIQSASQSGAVLKEESLADSCMSIILAEHFQKGGMPDLTAPRVESLKLSARHESDALFAVLLDLEAARRDEEFARHRGLLQKLTLLCSDGLQQWPLLRTQAKDLEILHRAVHYYIFHRDTERALDELRAFDSNDARLDYLVCREVWSLRALILRRRLSDALPVDWHTLGPEDREHCALRLGLSGLASDSLQYADLALQAALLQRSEYQAMNALLNLGYIQAWLACRDLGQGGIATADQSRIQRSQGLRNMARAIAVGVITNRGGDDWWKPIMLVEIANRARLRPRDERELSGRTVRRYRELEEEGLGDDAAEATFRRQTAEGLCEYLYKNTFEKLEQRDPGKPARTMPLVQSHNACCAYLIRATLDEDTSRLDDVSKLMLHGWLRSLREFVADALAPSSMERGAIQRRVAAFIRGFEEARSAICDIEASKARQAELLPLLDELRSRSTILLSSFSVHGDLQLPAA